MVWAFAHIISLKRGRINFDFLFVPLLRWVCFNKYLLQRVTLWQIMIWGNDLLSVLNKRSWKFGCWRITRSINWSIANYSTLDISCRLSKFIQVSCRERQSILVVWNMVVGNCSHLILNLKRSSSRLPWLQHLRTLSSLHHFKGERLES